MSAMRRVQFGFLACALFLAGAGQDAMNDETAQSVDATVDENVVLTGLPVPNLRERLEALNPSDPMAYFTLAEEVAYEADTRAERVLARQLYVLAYEIDHGLARASGRTGTLTPSVCLGLAALADRADEVLWLRALSPLRRRPVGRTELGAAHARSNATGGGARTRDRDRLRPLRRRPARGEDPGRS